MINPLNILVSQPNIYNISVFLPNIWSILKAYACEDKEVDFCTNWLDPIYIPTSITNVSKSYNLNSIHILLLSCYSWNTSFNIYLAKEIKKINPNCLIIFGGPDIDYTSLDKYTHSNKDLFINGDGEQLVKQILKKILNKDYDFLKIPGVTSLKSKDKSKYLLQDLNLSHLTLNFNQLKVFSNKHEYKRLVWETNRGCPYSCSFCNWGSSTMTKIRQYKSSQVHSEIELFPELRIDNLLIADGNFGIFNRDIEIAEHLAKIKKETGYPNSIIYSEAKNNTLNTETIAEIFYKNQLIPHVNYGLQHSDKSVLKQMSRTHILQEKQKKKITSLQQKNIPISTSIILGSPGDNFKKLSSLFNYLIEAKLDGEYRWFLWQLVPGSPAYKKSYRKEHKIKCVSRPTSTYRRKKNSINTAHVNLTEYIVSTYSYSISEWLDMYFLCCFMEVFHNSSVLRFIVSYFSKLNNERPIDLYIKLFIDIKEKKLPELGKIFSYCRAHMKNWSNPNFKNIIFEELDLNIKANFPSLYRSEEYIYFNFLYNIETCWEEISKWFDSNYFIKEKEWELLNLSKSRIITPNKPYSHTSSHIVYHNWPSFFAQKTDHISELSSPLEIKMQIDKKYIKNWEDKSIEKSHHRFTESIFGPAHSRHQNTTYSIIY